MKLTTVLAILMSVFFMSCSKEELSVAEKSDLQGSWRMVEVKNGNSGSMAKPGNEIGNVDITFNTNSEFTGLLTGVTPRNEISPSNYQTTADKSLLINDLKISNNQAETAWGNEFRNNFSNSTKFHFDAEGNLCLKSTGKTLVFVKII